MNHLILLIAYFLIIEIIIRFDFIRDIKLISNISFKVIKIFSSNKISDIWKEKATRIYSLLLLESSTKMLAIIFLVFCIFLVLFNFSNGFLDHMISLIGLLEAFIFILFYLKIRKKYL